MVKGRSWAGIVFMLALAAGGDENVPWRIVLVSEGEPGEPLIVSGRILGPDGVTPRAGIIMEVHQTDAEGYYSRSRSGGADPEPRIKGRIRTNAEGRYEIRTIKPGSYPGTRNPAHIHARVWGAGRPARWIDEFWFEGDPFISAERTRQALSEGSFSPVMKITRDGDGVLRCVRDIKLGPEDEPPR